MTRSHRASAALVAACGFVIASAGSPAAAQVRGQVSDGYVELARLESSDAELSTRYSDAHPLRVGVTAQIAQLRASLASPNAEECETIIAAIASLRRTLEAERSRQSTRYGARHPAIRALDARIRSLHASSAAACPDRSER